MSRDELPGDRTLKTYATLELDDSMKVNDCVDIATIRIVHADP